MTTSYDDKTNEEILRDFIRISGRLYATEEFSKLYDIILERMNKGNDQTNIPDKR